MHRLFWKLFGGINIIFGFLILLRLILFFLSVLIRKVPLYLFLKRNIKFIVRDISYAYLCLWSGFYLFNNANQMASLFGNYVFLFYLY